MPDRQTVWWCLEHESVGWQDIFGDNEWKCDRVGTPLHEGPCDIVRATLTVGAYVNPQITEDQWERAFRAASQINAWTRSHPDTVNRIVHAALLAATGGDTDT